MMLEVCVCAEPVLSKDTIHAERNAEEALGNQRES